MCSASTTRARSLAPDLQSEVHAPELTYELAKLLEAESRERQLLPVYASRQGGRGARLALPVHDLLTEEADWDAPTWDLDPGGSESLARTLEWLCVRLDSSFEFFAAWPPEDIDHALEMSIEQLAALVRGNLIGARTRYIVRSESAK